MNCDSCKVELKKHRLAITLYNHHHDPVEVRELANVCSVKCLIAWGYAYGTAQVANLVQRTKITIGQAGAVGRGILDYLKGPRS